jgi:hypothetical protein
MKSDFDDGAVWAFFAANALFVILVWLAVFGLFALIAAFVAPPRRKLRWFLLTLFVLGPVGVAFAAIAPAWVPGPTPGRRMQSCITCAARTDIDKQATGFTCWQCSQEHVGIRPAFGAGGRIDLLLSGS